MLQAAPLPSLQHKLLGVCIEQQMSLRQCLAWGLRSIAGGHACVGRQGWQCSDPMTNCRIVDLKGNAVVVLRDSSRIRVAAPVVKKRLVSGYHCLVMGPRADFQDSLMRPLALLARTAHLRLSRSIHSTAQDYHL